MPRYRTNILSFDVPDHWTDQSITAFRLPAPPGGGDASFVVTRDDGKGVSDFDRYLAKQLDQCRRGLPEFKLIRSDRVAVQDKPAQLVEFSWAKDMTVMQLRQVFVDCGFFATICTLTASPRDLDYFDGPWRSLMASMTFDRAEPGAPAPFSGAPTR